MPDSDSMQLPLNIHLRDTFCFSNFSSTQNEELVTNLKATISKLASDAPGLESIFIWGLPGIGKTHLLQSACQLARELDVESVYLPLGQQGFESPAILDGLHTLALVCIDDIQHVVGQPEWETGLFTLYENIKERGLLLIASEYSPAKTGFQLPDLVSRFQRGLVYGIHRLSHEQRLHVIRQRARLRGLEINDEVAAYMEKHFPRDLGSLVTLLEQLDQESLIQQRKITVPFIKSLII